MTSKNIPQPAGSITSAADTDSGIVYGYDRITPVNEFKVKYEALNGLLQKVQFNGENRAQGIFLLLALNVLEVANVMIHSTHADSDAAFLVLLRNIMETATKAAYVATSPKNAVPDLCLSDTKAQLKAFNGLPVSMRKDSVRHQQSVADLEQRCKNLKTSGAKEISVEGMLQHLGVQNWYLFYRLWSASTHAQLTALASQFLDPVNESKILPEAFKKGSSDN